MFDKLDVRPIISEHIRTLHKYREENVYPGDIFVFFGLPAICAALILYVFHTPVDRTASNILITSLSVFSALLLNLLMLLYDLVRKEEESGSDGSSDAEKLLREIFANISYSILVSVFCVAILLIAYLEIRSGIFLQIFSLVVYFLLIQFLLTLFMVLKRVHVLLSVKIIGPQAPPTRPFRLQRMLFRQRLSARRSGRGSPPREEA